jgi:FkbM family methyltransferase
VDVGTLIRIERLFDRIPFLEKELFLLRRLVRAGDVCLDIGAAGGAHLLVMARSVGAGGLVLGFEPRPGSLRALRRIVWLSGLASRVRLLQLALSDHSGRQSLRIPFVPTRAHFLGSSPHRAARAAFRHLPHREVEVVTRRLDDVVAEYGLQHVDVVKCDVEGAELLVLAGSDRLLDELRPVLIVEADDLHQRRFDATAQDVIDAVSRHGYRTFRFRGGRLLPVTGAVPDEDDYVFVPDERVAAVLDQLTAG